MANRLFLLDGMALAYRAHFAFLQRPIRTSKGINSSALYGFTTTLLELIEEQSPTHIAVAFDTPAPTARHREFPEYKAQREAMPEELAFAIPNLFRLCEALRIPALKLDGYEADDLIGTLVHRAEKEGFSCWMVTPDKDFGQLVTDHCKIFKPSKGTVSHEILGVQEVCEKWGVQRPTQVIDILALWGDASDNIPGVPGIGEKTASKLISQFGSLEELLARTAELKDKLRQSLEANSEQARLCKSLATIQLDVPIDISLDALKVQSPNLDAWRAFCDEFEFSSLGRRLLGQDYKVRGAAPVPPTPGPVRSVAARQTGSEAAGQLDLFSTGSAPESAAAVDTQAAATQEVVESGTAASSGDTGNALRTLRDIPHHYLIADTTEAREQLLGWLKEQTEFCFDTETTGLNPLESELVGVSFAWKTGEGWYLPVPSGREEALRVLSPFRSVFEDPQKGKIGHNLKFDVR
ncbi:MAG: DNA polymerase I, partial [Verrucomicrobia bacterium]|nr:DNA polymerase I [Verrucomicrobiota bacterium]